MRAVVTGATGLIGRHLTKALGAEVVWAGGRGGLDICDTEAVQSLIGAYKPDIIFNAAGYTKVDGAEVEMSRALETNALGPAILGQAAREVGATLVHLSSDYVFDGRADKPYKEDACTGPLCVFAVSKVSGEQLVGTTGGEWLIVRTSGVFGHGGIRPRHGSFIERLMAQARAGEPLRAIVDQVCAPTHAVDLAATMVALARSGARGVVHVTNSGSGSWLEFSRAVLDIVGLQAEVEPVGTAELHQPARRPAYSVLACDRLAELGLPALRPWREALAEHLATQA